MTTHLFSRAAQAGCTKNTCPASASIYGYAPSFEFTVAFIGAFAWSTVVYYHQSFLWPKWRLYSLLMAFGCLMESAGYVGRLLLHNDPFSKWGFKINVILLTIAPAFLSAGMYIMLKSLVILFGPQYSRLPPNAYAYVFVSADVVSIILQGVGGAISAVATKKKLLNQGVDIMIAGLVSQVFTLCIFAGLCVDFAMQVKKNHDLLPPARQKLIKSLRFKFTAGALAFAFLCIQIRCIYRVAELSQGWGSELMRKENDFIIMDSFMCFAAAASLAIFHPAHSLPEPEETLDDQGEQKQAREKKKGYSVMPDNYSPPPPQSVVGSDKQSERKHARDKSSEYSMYLSPPPPVLSTMNTCPRCACWEDRRSWI